MTKNKAISKIVSSYIDDNDLSNRKLANAINDQLGVSTGITYGAVTGWRSGAWLPLPTIIEILYQRADEPMRDFALSILKVLEPDDYCNIN